MISYDKVNHIQTMMENNRMNLKDEDYIEIKKIIEKRAKQNLDNILMSALNGKV